MNANIIRLFCVLGGAVIVDNGGTSNKNLKVSYSAAPGLVIFFTRPLDFYLVILVIFEAI